MGIPKFFRYISERYPLINKSIEDGFRPEIDNFYIDVNGVIHRCSHPETGKLENISEEEMIAAIFQFLDVIFKIVRPRKVFYVAVDGVAPRAKMNQQRSRRFRSAQDAVKKVNNAERTGVPIPEGGLFDSNCITPGTEFMHRLTKHFHFYFQKKFEEDVTWRDLKVIFSGQDVPGEGEHKIMAYIREQRSLPGWDPNTTHCIYGTDADLIMLGLVTHEPHFTLLRENVLSRAVQKKQIPDEFHLLHLAMVREYLHLEFYGIGLPFAYDQERIIDDFVFMCFFIGNDFLPNLPFLDIAEGTLDRMFEIYKQVLPTCSDYLTNCGQINWEQVKRFLVKLSTIERERLDSSLLDDYGSQQEEELDETFDSLSTDEPLDIPDEVLAGDPTNLKAQAPSQAAVTTTNLSDSESTKRLEAWKEAYYREKFRSLNESPAFLSDLANSYVAGLNWVLGYYYNGCPSWEWFYPFHYGPLASDLINMTEVDHQFSKGQPFKPFEQLLAVLPPASRSLLPQHYRLLMTSPPLDRFYPESFEVDMNGKKNDWEAVVLIPFIDQELLLQLSRQISASVFTADELERNKFGEPQLFRYSSRATRRVASTLPRLFADIAHCPCTMQVFTTPKVDPKPFTLLAGVRYGPQAPAGFPTLFVLQPTVSHRLVRAAPRRRPSGTNVMRVSDFNEQLCNLWLPGDSTTLTAVTSCEWNRVADALAQRHLGSIVFVDYPYQQPAQLLAISTAGCRLPAAGLGQPNRAAADWQRDSRMAAHSLLKRGIDVGHVNVLLHVRRVRAMENRLDGSRLRVCAAQDECVPLQAALPRVAVTDRRLVETTDVPGGFALHSFVVLTSSGGRDYGAIGQVVETSAERVTAVFESFASLPHLSSRLPIGARQPQELREVYSPLEKVSKRVGVSGRLLSCITGTLTLKPTGVNIGLAIKFTGKRTCVAGYARCVGVGHSEHWEFSERAVALLQTYKSTFPELFDALERTIDRDFRSLAVTDLFVDRQTAFEYQKRVLQWLSGIETNALERTSSDERTYSTSEISTLQRAATDQSNESAPRTFKLTARPHQLLRPYTYIDTLPPRKCSVRLSNRVRYIRIGGKVPFGLVGTVVGVSKDNKKLTVMFDTSFIGGVKLSAVCDGLSGMRDIPVDDLLNLSFFEEFSDPANAAAAQHANATLADPHDRPLTASAPQPRLVAPAPTPLAESPLIQSPLVQSWPAGSNARDSRRPAASRSDVDSWRSAPKKNADAAPSQPTSAPRPKSKPNRSTNRPSAAVWRPVLKQTDSPQPSTESQQPSAESPQPPAESPQPPVESAPPKSKRSRQRRQRTAKTTQQQAESPPSQP